MRKKNLSDEEETKGKVPSKNRLEAQNQPQEIISISVLDHKPEANGLLKTWIEGSPRLKLCRWRLTELAAAHEIAASPPDVTLVEARFSGDRGLQCAYLLKRLQPQLTVVMFTDAADLATCIRCYQAGADGYVTTLKGGQFEETIRDALVGLKPFPREIGKMIAEHWAKRFVLPDGNLLTQGQASVMAALVQGKFDKEIAADRGTSAGTIHAILHSVYAKVGARSRTQAVARFLPLGEAFTQARRIRSSIRGC